MVSELDDYDLQKVYSKFTATDVLYYSGIADASLRAH
jgi:hypothetical protein